MLFSDSAHQLANFSPDSLPFSQAVPTPAEACPEPKPAPAVRIAQLAVKGVWIAPKPVLASGPAQPTDVFLVTVVTDNQSGNPIQFQVESFCSPAEGGFLPLASGGVVAYRSDPDTPPTSLDYRILLIETPAGMHGVDCLYQRVIDNTKYRSVRTILTNVATVAPPSASLMSVASDVILNLATRLIQGEGDEDTNQMLCARGSFDKEIDNLGSRYGLISQANAWTRVNYEIEII